MIENKTGVYKKPVTRGADHGPHPYRSRNYPALKKCEIRPPFLSSECLFYIFDEGETHRFSMVK